MVYVVAAVHSFTFSVRSRNGESVHSSSVKKLDEKSSVVPDPETECVKFFVMCTTDLHHILKLCGLFPGQEELLPPWIKEMAVKQLTKDGKHGIIHEMCTQLWYEDNPIPLFPAIYKMVQDKAFGGMMILTVRQQQ